MLAFQSTRNSTVPPLERAAVRCLAVLAAILSLAPLLITTLGVRWGIQTHNLWLKPWSPNASNADSPGFSSVCGHCWCW